MVVVEYLCSEMEKLTGLPKGKIIGGLTEIGAPTEEGEMGKLMSELTPNRPDWFSMEGLARALRSYYTGKAPAYSAKKSDYCVMVDKTVRGIRPYTACAVVKGLRFDDRRIRDMVLLQEKLLATLGRRVKKFGMGVYPLGNIAFPVRYTTMKPDKIAYVPLGWPGRAGAAEILAKHPKGLAHGHVLKGLDRYPVFVDAKDRIMALIPIVNSAETGQVAVGTKEVFVEVSGTDMAAVQAALNIVVCTFADMGGTAYEVEVSYPGERMITPDLRMRKRKVDLAAAGRLLGVEIGEKQAARMLARMGYGWKDGAALVPPYRADVMHEVDIIEDIAIVYGYNNFVPTLPDFFHCGRAAVAHPAHAALRGMGFTEAFTFILTNKKKAEAAGYAGGIREISNPSGEEFTGIRPDLIADMLNVLAINKMKGLPQKFYEIGRVYEDGKDKRKVAFAVCDRKLEFSDARGCLQTLMRELGKEFALKKGAGAPFDPELSAEIVVGGKGIGRFGNVSEAVARKFGLEFPVYLCEIEA